MASLGLVLQKLAHNQNNALPAGRKYKVVAGIVCSPCWWGAFAMMGLLPFPMDFLSYQYAAQSLVAPFAGLTLILNQCFSPMILGEKLSRVDVIASSVVLLGCLVTTLSGSHEEVNFIPTDIVRLIADEIFLQGFSILVALIVFMMYMVQKYSPVQYEEVTAGVVPKNLEEPVSRSFPVEMSGYFEVINRKLMPFYYGFISGGLGGLQNVCFKCIGLMVKNPEGIWTTPFPYIAIVLTVTLAVTQLSYLNKGISLYDAVLILPLYNACYIFLSSSIGALFYQEFKLFTHLQWVFFPVGIVVTLLGISLFLFKYSDHQMVANFDDSNSVSEDIESQDEVVIAEQETFRPLNIG